MASVRAAALAAAKAAAEVHTRYDAKKRLIRRIGGLDVYRLAEDLDVPVRFTKLTGLLGVYLREELPGIAITTERPPAIQRFTCAHELGHHWLKHATTFDAEACVGFDSAEAQKGDPNEVQANFFAESLLMPRWLVQQRAIDLMNAGLRLPDPLATYQLALRLGCSFKATVHMLGTLQLVEPEDLATLRKFELKTAKQRLLREYAPADWRRDVWLLTDQDDGDEVRATQADVVVLRVRDLATSGYITTTRSTNSEKAPVVAQWSDRSMLPREAVGASGLHFSAVGTEAQGIAHVEVVHRRPWESEELELTSLHVAVDVQKVSAGLSRPAIEQRLQEAAGVK